MSTDIIGLLSTQHLWPRTSYVPLDIGPDGISTWLQTHGMVLYMGVNPKIGVGPPLFSPSILGAHPYFWKHPYI